MKISSVDYQLQQLINGPAGLHPLWDAFFVQVAVLAEPAFIALVVIWFAYGWWRDSAVDRRGAMVALIAAGAALAVNAGIGLVYDRHRPIVAHPTTVHLLVAHTSDASFPSDHASAGFAIAAVLCLAHRRLGLVALSFGTLVCFARVYVGDHYPGDVVAGSLLGSIMGIVIDVGAKAPVARLLSLIDRAVMPLRGG